MRGRTPDPRVDAPSPVLSFAPSVRFGVIGDYGLAGANAQAVASMVKGWSPDLISTTGDNNYEWGARATIDLNIGQYYSDYSFPYTGAFTPTRAITRNLFFPSLGIHDWYTSGATPYLSYFSLPGNERYYDLVWGPVHLIAISSDANEPDGITSNSAQAQWLERRLANSSSPWCVVYMHHPPFSSGRHGSQIALQWPYRAWGATAVLAGHDHTYERIIENSLPYFVNGLGGRSIYDFDVPISQSQFRFNSNYGAMLVHSDAGMIRFEFYAITNTVGALDIYTVTVPATSNRAYLPIVKR